MSNALYESISRVARHEAAARATASVGVVTEVHTTAGGGPTHAVSVKLRDSALVLPRVPVAVGALGFVATPAVDDLVLVVFTDGDHHGPVVVGSLHHTELAPPEHGPDQLVLSLPPGESEPKIKLTLDGATGEVKVETGKTTITTSDDGTHIVSGDAEINVDTSGSEEVTVTSGQSTLTLSANGNATLEASGDLKLSGVNIEIKGSGQVKVSGATVDIN